MTVASTTIGFATVLREATADAHRAAERVDLLGALLRGELDRSTYGRLVVQYLAIYEALESANEAMAGHPVAGAFVDPAVCRVESLRRDADHLLGEDWFERPEAHILVSTAAYVERLRELGATWPGGWLAHHYVRYLGDLSGGQIIGRRLEATSGLTADAGASFYAFPDVEDTVAWKAAYRARLDAAPWGDTERRRIVDEARNAFRWNTIVLTDVADHR